MSGPVAAARREPGGTGDAARVVSLVPSVTETLLAWGVRPVACTRFCERPDLPHVGGTKDPDVAAIAALGPDLVVVDEEENRKEDAEALEAAGLRVHVTAVRDVADVGPALEALAAAVGVAAPGGPTALAAWRVDVDGGRRLTAAVPIWRRPWMWLGPGTYGASLLALLGFDVVPADAGRYPAVELAVVAALRPACVLAPTEPYPFAERHLAELAGVAPASLVDGQDLFWWGARTAAAIDRLGSALAGVAPPGGV